MKRLFTAATLATALAATPALLHGVTFGEPDGTRHPYVGTIIFQTASGYWSCSGTLLSPTVFLTAGHCTEEAGVTNLKTWAKFDSSISFPGRANYPSLGAYLDDKKNGWIPGTAIPHPQYDDYAQWPQTYDVGVVLLRQGVKMNTYGTLPPLDFLATIRSAADNHFTVVGYGMQGYIQPFYEDIYARYQGQVQLLELNSTWDGGQSAKYSNNPGTAGGSCYGDSGGPVFYGTTNMVTSVVSWGQTPCIGVDYQFRTDTAVAQDFVRPFLK